MDTNQEAPGYARSRYLAFQALGTSVEDAVAEREKLRNEVLSYDFLAGIDESLIKNQQQTLPHN